MSDRLHAHPTDAAGSIPIGYRQSSDPLLDHEYDGIREYDNPLPGWWVALLWGSVIFSVVYLFYYHSGVEGRSIEDDYQGELAAAAARLIEQYGELQADPETILKFTEDSVAMAGMGGLFKARCAQCHASDGGGSIGPNLLDDSYVHIKTVGDIYRVLNEGVVAKGMPAWGQQLSSTQLVLMSAYVANLRGRGPGSKAAEGTLIPPWPPVPVSTEASTGP
jgi:cytochrome c oxidase cbb3-type subunit III